MVSPTHWVQCSACEGRSLWENVVAEAPGRSQWLSYVIAVYLIGLFLWRAFIPASEYPSRSAQVLRITFELFALTGLIGLRLRASQRKRREVAGTLLFWLALVAGVGLFFIRMSGEAGWRTGHLRYELAPRPTRR